MIVVIDTNVVISAALIHGTPRDIIEAIIADPRKSWFVSEELLAEYADVLRRRNLKLSEAGRAFWLSRVDHSTSLVESLFGEVSVRDPDDVMVLQCAIACEADSLITGDRDLLVLRRVGGTRIVRPADFLRLIATPP